VERRARRRRAARARGGPGVRGPPGRRPGADARPSTRRSSTGSTRPGPTRRSSWCRTSSAAATASTRPRPSRTRTGAGGLPEEIEELTGPAGPCAGPRGSGRWRGGTGAPNSAPQRAGRIRLRQVPDGSSWPASWREGILRA
jgi:hypothetical protein